MNPRFEKLKTLLRELFQLDQPDLDFGLYRIMHAKADEITQFLDRDMLPQVIEAFAGYRSAVREELKKELDELVAGIERAGMEPEQSPNVHKLRGRLEEQSVDIEGLENDVYDHLFRFFRRYYHEGDFIAKRVYKPGVYAIPYEGEEVKLHWANKDQYYIKTSEYLRDYAFRLRPDDEQNPMRVHFKLVDAAEGAHNNVKASNGDRVFVLADEDFIEEESGELTIRFHYRPATMDDWTAEAKASATAAAKKKPPKQKDLLDIAERRILAADDPQVRPWIDELRQPHVKTNGERADYNRLSAHLRRYAARNTFDYFIHKDLGGFLRRELDFYIKNEVMHLDDIEHETVPRVEQYLSKIKIIRKVASKIIAFLAQLEDFSKKLWLKKKFVTETVWCVRLGMVPEEFYDEIATNEAQRKEWEELGFFAVTTAVENGQELFANGPDEDGSVTWLKAHPTLVLDTQHFSADFTIRLLDALGDLDELTDGVLFHSENFQALSIMQRRYKEHIESIYIDPPYNTDASPIAYKNGYKASSWVSLIDSRLALSSGLLAKNGILVAAIDDEQQRELNFILSGHFGNRLLGTIVVRSNPSGRPTQTGYSVSHEYLLFAGAGQGSSIGRMPPTEKQRARFSQTDEKGAFEWRNLRREGSDSERADRPSMYYPIYICDNNIRIPNMMWDDENEAWLITEDPKPGEQIVYPDNEAGEQKRWRWESRTVVASRDQLAVRKDRSGRDYIYYKRRPHKAGVVAVSSWFSAKYSATEHGTALIKDLFGKSVFSYPKSVYAVSDALYVAGASDTSNQVLDYFAGSGTTGHAVINLNREDGGRRKFILVEMGDYFDTVLLPRLKKVTFSPEWKDGKPKRLATEEETERSPRVMKVVRLESYEDTLNNLEPRRTETQQATLYSTEAGGEDGFREQYLLQYMLDVETRGSASLLNIIAFRDPTTYELNVKRPGSDESKPAKIDLIETFNWLIGLRVHHIAAPIAFEADAERDTEGRLQMGGRLKPSPEGPHWFRRVEGTAPDGRKTLIVWRKLTDDIEKDNLVLDHYLKEKLQISTRDFEFDLIYVNGDNNLENLKQPDDTWKVRLIEEDFHRLMFDVEGV